MRRLSNSLFKVYLRYRQGRINHAVRHAQTVQRSWLDKLVLAARDTEWGRIHDFRQVRSYRQFVRRVPIQDYETLRPYIHRMMAGERDVLWNGRVRHFSKSSGTTGDKSKFIPVSQENFRSCHRGGAWDATALFYRERPDAALFQRKSLLMGGSLKRTGRFPYTYVGDVSAVMISQMPFIARPFFTPDFETALMEDFEEKIDRMAERCSREDVVMLGGVPTWTVVLFRKMLERTGRSHILDIWPNLQAYIHGGVSFTPYRDQFRSFLPGRQVSYQEIYNASEGFFAIQDDLSTPDLLLLPDNGVFYEFMPISEWSSPQPRAIPLGEVELGKDYAVVITTNAGLWRYTIGDTVTFTSLAPYRIRITGRTRQFVNAFGEEVMVYNTDRALSEVCKATDTIALEYTVAPIYFKDSGKGGHEWLVEFEKEPTDLPAFARLLDEHLQRNNSDYEAKRYRDLAMEPLRLRAIPPGTFHNWLKKKGKYGGQHKVPRLSNERTYVDDIVQFLTVRTPG